MNGLKKKKITNRSKKRSNGTKYIVYSGAPAVEGRHAEPHTYRTYAFNFVWSFSSAVEGSRARTYDDYDVAQHGAHTGQHALHTSMQFDIRGPFYGQLTAVKSRYPLTSTT